MTSSTILIPSYPEVETPTAPEVFAERSWPKFKTDFEPLLCAETLAALCASPLTFGSADEHDSISDVDRDELQHLDGKCAAFVKELRDTTNCRRRSTDLAAGAMRLTQTPLKRRLACIVAALLAGSLTGSITSLLPDTVMGTDRGETWKLLLNLMSAPYRLRWHTLSSLQIEGIPERLSIADVMVDLVKHVRRQGDLRLLHLALMVPEASLVKGTLSQTNPLSGPASELRLCHVLDEDASLEDPISAVMFRQSGRIIVIGAGPDSVNRKMSQIQSALDGAGLGCTDMEPCVNLRTTEWQHGGFSIDCLTGRVRVRLNDSAYQDLESRIRRCLTRPDSGPASLQALQEWTQFHGPGLVHRESAPGEWGRAPEIYQRILDTIQSVGYRWPTGLETIAVTCDQASMSWVNYLHWNSAGSWMGRAFPEEMNLSEQALIASP